MHNAHLRMGRLEYLRTGREYTTRLTLPIDRIVLEPAAQDGIARCHLMSVVGGDQEVAAVAAAVSESANFTATLPGGPVHATTMGDFPIVFRVAVTVAARKHSIKHLVAVSNELALTRPGGNSGAERTVLCDGDEAFILYRLGIRFGIPTLPEWSAWIAAELKRRRTILPLSGLGCNPVLITESKASLLKLISEGVRKRVLRFPVRATDRDWCVARSFSEPQGPPQIRP